MRATWQQVGEENFCSVLVSLIPTISGPEGEPVQKTKPTQHGVKELRYRRAAPHRPFRPLRSVSRNVSNSTRHKKKPNFSTMAMRRVSSPSRAAICGTYYSLLCAGIIAKRLHGATRRTFSAARAQWCGASTWPADGATPCRPAHAAAAWTPT